MTKNQRFINLDVENLNIIDKNGNRKMTLFNDDNIPPVWMDGKDLLPGHRQNDPISGIMFYNNEGDEAGGLIYGSSKDENGEYESMASLTFDQYKQDQVVQMHYNEQNGDRHYGFSIYDRPNKPLSELLKSSHKIESEQIPKDEKAALMDKLWEGNTARAFMGKTVNGEVAVRLMDSKGNQRIRMVIDENDVPKMEFLDANGEVIYKLPPDTPGSE